MDSLLSSMNASQNSGVPCDVVLCAEGEAFACHKHILASCGSYLKEMITNPMAETAQSRVAVNHIKASKLRALLDFACRSTIGVTDPNVEPLL